MQIFAQYFTERLDWFNYGISSANRTAAFIACAIIASFAIASIFKRIGFFISVILSIVLFYFLLQTQSRGALTALLASVAIFLLVSKLKLTKLKIIVAAISIFICGAFYLNSALSDRMANMATLQSSSANCRADIYLSGMKILTDAVYGLNGDSPVKIYMRWYQNPNDPQTYLSMINSHLEFMCRYGFFGVLAYIFFWSFILNITYPHKKDIFCASAFSTWICLGICASFSNVMNYWVLWIMPAAMLSCSIFINKDKFAQKTFYISFTALSLISLISIYALSACLPRDCKLRFEKNGNVYCGNSNTAKYLLHSPSEEILGNRYGGELKQFCQANNVGAYVCETLKSENAYDAAIFCAPKNISELKNIQAKKILLNPAFFDDFENPIEEYLHVYLGSFSDWRNRKKWEMSALKNNNIKIKIIDGVSDYIPNWTSYFNNANN